MVRTRLAFLAGTWFGCGYAPLAPGTVGALAALLIALVLQVRFGWGGVEFLLLGAAVTVPGIWAAHVVEESTGREDPGIVVIDEVAGLWVTLAGATVFNWRSWLLAFVLFRLFDIWKPPPVRQLERLPKGIGVMADDLMAGLYGALLLYLAGRFHLY